MQHIKILTTFNLNKRRKFAVPNLERVTSFSPVDRTDFFDDLNRILLDNDDTFMPLSVSILSNPFNIEPFLNPLYSP